jgi:hypothetical protein
MINVTDKYNCNGRQYSITVQYFIIQYLCFLNNYINDHNLKKFNFQGFLDQLYASKVINSN